MKKLFYLTAALTLVFFGCHKEVPKGGNGEVQNGLHVQLVSGNYQTDTVGNKLKDSIVVKVTNDGIPVEGYTVQIARSGCEDQTVTSKATSDSGEAAFAWYLSGETGNQSLNVVLIDGNLNRRDSVSASAIGIAPTGHGWHRGGCIQTFPVNKVTTLASGRILASVNAAGYPLYSDNNAISWRPLKTFTKDYFITKILSSGNDIFLATQNQGIFHSADNGQTWTNISGGIISVLDFSDLAYTRSGKLIFTNNYGVFESDDKGQSWNEIDYGLPMGPCTYPVEQTNGDLFIIGSDASVYKLPVHTGTWVSIASAGGFILSNVQSMFIDDQGRMFVGGPHDAPGGVGTVNESIDGGTSWSQVFTQQHNANSYANIDFISKVGGNYYFSFGGTGIYQTANFSQYSNLTFQFANLGVVSYALAANSNFVIGTTGYGVYYKVP